VTVDDDGGNTAFGALLRHYRLAVGLSQEDLAERARMSVSGIGALERGVRQTPYPATVARLARALALPEAEIEHFKRASERPRSPKIHRDRPHRPSASDPPSNLPAWRTSLVGREGDVSTVVRMVEGGRLVSVVGTGGIGKTRIAIAVGNALVDSATLPVLFVELAALATGSSVAPALAQALKLQEVPDRSLLDVLVAHLEQRALLLIVDNCEHVIAEVASCARTLLDRCASVRILATSREPLRISGEQIYRLPSLGVPAPNEALRLRAADVAQYASLVLFAARAQAVDHGFRLNDDNSAIVGEVCRRLDGIPLAIELAAARVKNISLGTLSEMLDRRMRILTGGDRTALPRHQTMRALVDWSYDLLTPAEQRLFERLSVFAGGCDLASATTVYGQASIDDLGVLEIMSSLVDKSMVVADLAASEPRYRLLETTREYARERLTARGDAALAAHRHARASFNVAERLRREFYAAPNSVWFERAACELENWRAAFTWTLEACGDIVLGQRLADVTLPWWTFFSPAEGRRYVSAAATLVDDTTPLAVSASLEKAAANLALVFGNFGEALAKGSRAFPVLLELGDSVGAAASLLAAGRANVHLGRFAEGEPLLHRVLEMTRSLKLPVLAGLALQEMAFVCSARGDLAGARTYLAKALAVFEGINGEPFTVIARGALAELEFRAGNAARAVELMPALPAYVPPIYLARYLLTLSAYLVACDRWGDAQVRAGEALRLAWETHDEARLVSAIGRLAAIAALAKGGDQLFITEYARGARLFGYVDARLSSLGVARPDTEQVEYDRAMTALREAIGASSLGSLLAQGAGLTAADAVDCALAGESEPHS
jgi:predicted ATPase/transcriptional regulator with XRE-family HTH domain